MASLLPLEKLYIGIDWARVSDHTWLTVGNDQNDVIDWFKYPHIPYLQQIEMMVADLKRPRQGVRITGGREEPFEWTYLERIYAVKGDSTGEGDMPMEVLQSNTSLPVGTESHVKFTLQSKNEIYTTFDNALFRDAGDPFRFSYPADHPLAAEFEDQMTALIREYKGDGEYLSPHHPDVRKTLSGDQPTNPTAADEQGADADRVLELERLFGPDFQGILAELVFRRDPLKELKKSLRLDAVRQARWRKQLERWKRQGPKGPEPIVPEPTAPNRISTPDPFAEFPAGWPPRGWSAGGWPVPKNDSAKSILMWFRFWMFMLPHQAEPVTVSGRPILADVSGIVKDAYRLIRFLSRRERKNAPQLSPRTAKRAKRSADDAWLELGRLERWVAGLQSAAEQADSWPPDAGWHFRPGQYGVNGKGPFPLTGTLLNLLQKLATPNRRFTIEELTDAARGKDSPTGKKAMQSHLSTLGKILRENLDLPAKPSPIRSKGRGAALVYWVDVSTSEASEPKSPPARNLGLSRN